MGDRVTRQAPTGSGGTVYTAGTNISIDSSNVISCTLAPLTVALDGTSLTPSSPKLNGFTTSTDGTAPLRWRALLMQRERFLKLFLERGLHRPSMVGS